MMNLEQITSAVHETCFFGVLHALLAGKNVSLTKKINPIRKKEPELTQHLHTPLYSITKNGNDNMEDAYPA